MQLKKLLKSLGKECKVYGKLQIDINLLCDDSRKCKKGNLFVAISGFKLDAHKYIPDVINKGVVAVVGENVPKKEWVEKIVYIRVPNSRKALSLLASAWWDYPLKKLKIIGITGTDGKTTTANIIYWIFYKAGYKVGLVSSVSAKLGSKDVDTGFHVTTPEPIILHSFLARMVKNNLKYAILEVTSHGLDQYRVWGIPFETGVLTNITSEHLDYHKSMKDYIKTKSLLFKNVRKAILNKADSHYLQVKKYIPKNVEIITYPASNLDPLIQKAIKERFPEIYNQFNAQAACLVAKEYGIETKDIITAIITFPQIPGRLEEVKNAEGLKIFIDFAHTPNALNNVLIKLKKRRKGRLICILGCAGERDVKKRLVMGEISARIADVSVLTAEDPRSEKVDTIIKQMTKGAAKSNAVEVDTNYFNESTDQKKENRHIFLKISERGVAISYSIQRIAKKGDTIVICGKGHEKSMAYNGVEYPWSDQDAVKIALRGGVKEIKRTDN